MYRDTDTPPTADGAKCYGGRPHDFYGGSHRCWNCNIPYTEVPKATEVRDAR